MSRLLGEQDFPLIANGQYVYRRTDSSPLIGPVDPAMAADLALRLNRDDCAFPSSPLAGTFVELTNQKPPGNA